MCVAGGFSLTVRCSRCRRNQVLTDRLTLAYCSNYLCPDTLACVSFPHHCPCPWPANEDKFELADGQRTCVSKGGFKEGEAARKVELMRQGKL